MKISQYFLPTLKEDPVEAQIVSHRLLLRAGMIQQSSAGIYSWLPLGLRVLKKIEQIVREEQEAIGAIEVLMPTIQSADLWYESKRYDDYGQEMLRIKDRHERQMLYGPTNEELITDIFRRTVKSYKQVPLNLFHIQWKFRDEIRPRFGVMRGREFLMKDGYTFDLDFESAKKSYDLVYQSYLSTFKRMGLKALAVRADSGAIGGNLSHEFQILAKTGESQIYYDAKIDEVENDIDVLKSLYAATDELHDPDNCLVPAERLKVTRGIEVGHIFYFGTKYSEPMNAFVTNHDGKNVPLEMGSYGIGVSRLVGAIVEASHDDNGIVWPEAVAPFQVGLLNLKVGHVECDTMCNEIYNKLKEMGVDCLYDDSKESPGVKFSRMDLIGLPHQVVIGPKMVKENKLEYKNRATGEKAAMNIEALFKMLSKIK